ncbi:hypothetical protein KEM54_002394 [Ascosphaera aggregata]|nr:hypothetical protein KEM54_002394 [Ascosphaera aggregata]
MSNQAAIRILRELNSIHQTNDLSIAAACQEYDVRRVRGLIIGAPDTPYEFGFFEFAIEFPDDYPTRPPNVLCLTTNNNTTRFNPNIYSSGKVCLSILGTWRGTSGEQWSSAQGLESILLSIQSLMSADPYENEPGYERRYTSRDKKAAESYVEKIRHETLRISVINRVESILGIPNDASPKRKRSLPNTIPSGLKNKDEPLYRAKSPKCKGKEKTSPEPGTSTITDTPGPTTLYGIHGDLQHQGGITSILPPTNASGVPGVSLSNDSTPNFSATTSYVPAPTPALPLISQSNNHAQSFPGIAPLTSTTPLGNPNSPYIEDFTGCLSTFSHSTAQPLYMIAQSLPETSAVLSPSASNTFAATPADDGAQSFVSDASEAKEKQSSSSAPAAIWDPFSDLIKRRFLWYYDAYYAAIQRGIELYPKKTPFVLMPFETPSNSMFGGFDYPDLLVRLEAIKDAILEETDSWGEEVENALVREGRVFSNLKRQCEQVVQRFKEKQDFTIDISLATQPDPQNQKEKIENPFIWDITYFGKPMTHLDGGIINMKCHISPRFPFEHPRVIVESPKLFHLRIAPASGLVCYECPIKKEEDMMEHIQGIIAALEGDEEKPYDPRMKVNREAWEVVWGKPQPMPEIKDGETIKEKVLDKGNVVSSRRRSTNKTKQSEQGSDETEEEKTEGSEETIVEKDKLGREVSGWKVYHRMLRRSVQIGLDG